MKKIVSILLSLVTLLSVSLTALAADTPQIMTNREVITFDNGDYATIETIIDDISVMSNERASRSSSKTYTYRNSAGSTLWSFTLKASFSYNGSSSSVTRASTSYSISNSSWSCDDHYATESGNTAYGYGSFSSSIQSKDVELSLTCDKNGNIR